MRVTTVGLALVQGYGFATFLERIPGAVATPGTGFVGQTTLLITGGAVLVGWLGEVIAESARGDVAEVQLLPLSEAGAATDVKRGTEQHVEVSTGAHPNADHQPVPGVHRAIGLACLILMAGQLSSRQLHAETTDYFQALSVPPRSAGTCIRSNVRRSGVPAWSTIAKRWRGNARSRIWSSGCASAALREDKP